MIKSRTTKRLTKVDEIELGQVEILGSEHVTLPVGVVSGSDHSARARPSTSFDRLYRGQRGGVGRGSGGGSSRGHGGGSGARTSGGSGKFRVGNPSSCSRLNWLLIAVFRLVDRLSLRQLVILRVDDDLRRESSSGEVFGVGRRSNPVRSFGESGLDRLLGVQRRSGRGGEGGGSGLDGRRTFGDDVSSFAGGFHSFCRIVDGLSTQSETLDRLGWSYLGCSSPEEGLVGGDGTTGGESIGGGKEGKDESKGDEIGA